MNAHYIINFVNLNAMPKQECVVFIDIIVNEVNTAKEIYERIMKEFDLRLAEIQLEKWMIDNISISKL